MDVRKLGPFKVIEAVGPASFKLDLPESMKIHPVFYFSLWESAKLRPNTEVPIEDSQIISEDQYEVEKIIGYRKVNKRHEYLVKWLNFDESENTWEPIRNLTNCKKLLKEFKERNKNLLERGGNVTIVTP